MIKIYHFLLILLILSTSLSNYSSSIDENITVDEKKWPQDVIYKTSSYYYQRFNTTGSNYWVSNVSIIKEYTLLDFDNGTIQIIIYYSMRTVENYQIVDGVRYEASYDSLLLWKYSNYVASIIHFDNQSRGYTYKFQSYYKIDRSTGLFTEEYYIFPYENFIDALAYSLSGIFDQNVTGIDPISNDYYVYRNSYVGDPTYYYINDISTWELGKNVTVISSEYNITSTGTINNFDFWALERDSYGTTLMSHSEVLVLKSKEVYGIRIAFNISIDYFDNKNYVRKVSYLDYVGLDNGAPVITGRTEYNVSDEKIEITFGVDEPYLQTYYLYRGDDVILAGNDLKNNYTFIINVTEEKTLFTFCVIDKFGKDSSLTISVFYEELSVILSENSYSVQFPISFITFLNSIIITPVIIRLKKYSEHK